MLLTVWFNEPFRSSRDLDLLGYGDPDPQSVLEDFKGILGMEYRDGVHFDVDRVRMDRIREDNEYGGFRIRTTAGIKGPVSPSRSTSVSGTQPSPVSKHRRHQTLSCGSRHTTYGITSSTAQAARHGSRKEAAVSVCVEDYMSRLDGCGVVRSGNRNKTFAHAYPTDTDSPVARAGDAVLMQSSFADCQAAGDTSLSWHDRVVQAPRPQGAL